MVSPKRGKKKLATFLSITHDCFKILLDALSEYLIEATMMRRADKTAEMNVKADTTSVCSRFPHGTSHTG